MLDPSSLLAKIVTVIQERMLPGEAFENLPLLLRKVLKFQNTRKVSYPSPDKSTGNDTCRT